jgi:DNA (cytosine-5)-methyltransferase 1
MLAGLIVGNVADKLQDFVASCNYRVPRLDLLVGGPPCQGFSLAGRRDPSDPRNHLVDFFIAATKLLCPRAVLIENVPAINAPLESGQSRTSELDNIVRKLESHNYVASIFRLESSKVGVPQKRIRLFILGILEPIFEKLPAKYKLLWLAENGVARLIGATGHSPVAGEALADIGSEGYKVNLTTDYKKLPYAKLLRFSRRYAVPAALKSRERVGHGELLNHDLRKHKPGTIDRFRFYFRLKKLGLDEHLVYLASKEGEGHIKERIYDHLYKNGLSPEKVESLSSDLAELTMRFKTRKHTQILLDSGLPASTITTLPDDLVHYSEPRVLSVRELARLQSFPDSFIFKGKPTTGGFKRQVETPQYSQVGNAVPPLVARAIGRLIKCLL